MSDRGAVEQVDVVVIGMGPGGEDVAGKLAEAGLNVVGIEKELVGGECPYWGCVPTKMMIRAADLLAEARRIPGFAGTATVTPDWRPIARRIRQEATDTWNDQVAVERFEKKGGHFVRGAGRLTGPAEVSVNGSSYSAARAIVIATGTSASIPPILGLDQVTYWTNRDAVKIEELPRSLIMLGGGAVGLEFAQVFARFGIKVTVVEALPRLLPMEEPEASELLVKVFAHEGIAVRVGANIASVAKEGNAIVLNIAGGDRVIGDRLLVATGRNANLKQVGVEAAGIDPSTRWLPVDDHLRTAPKVWGVGDVTGHGQFTHVAMYQADIAVADILGKKTPPADYRALPRVTFTDPEIAGAGLTEEQARQRGRRLRVGTAQVPSSARGWIHGPGNEGFIKLVEDAEDGILVGATSAGPRGGDVLSMLALAIEARIPTETLRHMIYAYPTFYHGIEDALRALKET
jgi:pyruvate/2-oxoglutarate dehydrogenase complex dihydrolipoamide dehydrogenase (E3) component